MLKIVLKSEAFQKVVQFVLGIFQVSKFYLNKKQLRLLFEFKE